jgi:hypothetical protein
MSTPIGWATIVLPIYAIDEEVKQVLEEEEEVTFLEGSLLPSENQKWEEEVILSDDGLLIIISNDRPNGEYKELEALLEKKRIPFDRVTGQLDDGTGEIKYVYRPLPFGGEMHRHTCNIDGYDMVPLYKIKEAMVEGRLLSFLQEYYPDYESLEDIAGRFKEYL